MEPITRNVSELESDERRVYEAALKRKLNENQQVIIQVINLNTQPDDQSGDQPPVQPVGQSPDALPEWCDVYSGLSDDEIRDVEQLILDRSDMTRSS